MKILELFSGTGSVGKAALTLGYDEVVSVDLCNKYSIPTHLDDILTWDYKQYQPGYFDVVWASPPCTCYSIMLNAHKHLDVTALMLDADKIVNKSLEIIQYFGPKYWILENPQSGRLKDRAIMQGLPYIDADYCKYGYPYRKRTRFWTNRTCKLQMCKKDCMFIDGNKHVCRIGDTGDPKKKYLLSPSEAMMKYHGVKYDLAARYSIPQLLLLDLLPSS
jgi:site-specific DNA-cytosine methylase